MGEPGAGDIKMRRIWMIHRRQQPALARQRLAVDGFAETFLDDHGAQ